MADRVFTIILDILQPLKVDLTLPPFMDGHGQLSADDVQKGCTIASPHHIHVECAIGRIKQYRLLKGVFPLKMAWLADQIVHVCA